MRRFEYIGGGSEKFWEIESAGASVTVHFGRMGTAGQTQRYNCGDDGITYFHVSASSYHSGGVNVALADGSVRFVADNIDFPTWQAMGTKAGGEPLPPP